MLDLDKYIENSVQIKLFGEKYDILEPNMEMIFQVDGIEKNLTEENVKEKRLELLELLINHNKQGCTFIKEELAKLPFEAVSNCVGEICAMRLNADKDPNSNSQSQKAK